MNRTGAFIIAVILVFRVVAAHAENKVYTLQDAYQSAFNNNEIIKISEESLSQSGTRLDQAWAYLYPSVTGQASYRRYNEILPPGDNDFIFQPLTQFQTALVLTQPLYTGGRTLAALRTARTLQEVSRKDLNSTKQDTMLSVASAYYEVLKARKMVEKSRESMERMGRHKRVTEREAATRKTKANISNLLRARTLVSQARIALTRDENNLLTARRRLHLLTKLPEDGVLAEPAPENQPVDNLEALKATALANRTDYGASQLKEKVAGENIRIVKGSHYPQAYAEGALQYANSNPATMLDGTIYYGGIRLQVPIFEGGLMKAELSEARSKLRQAELSSQYLQRSIETEVYEAYVNYQTVSSVLEAVKLQYDDATSNFAAVENMFSQGLVSSLALIDAQQALFLAERELVTATYDRHLAILKLKKSIGLLEKTKDWIIGGSHATS